MGGTLSLLAMSPVGTAYVVAGAFLLFRAWRGWRLGPVRQGVGLAALAFGIGAGMVFGGLTAPLFKPLGLPDPILAVCGGLVLGLVVYLGLLVAAAVVFKDTEDQSFALVRLGYGLLGLILGVAVGVFFLGVALVGIRVTGSVLDGRQRVRTGQSDRAWVVELRSGLEQGVFGGVIQTLDPVPEEVYGMLLKSGQVAGTPGGMYRFLANPEWRKVLGERRVLELQRDPVLMRSVLEGRLLDLLKNPRVVGLLNDKELRTRLKDVDFEKALDYALPKPEKGAARVKRP